jgi:ABC-type lipoprotein export system ATPase subunit
MTAASTPLLEVEHLARTFRGEGVATRALRDASFAIDAGAFVSIMGASGSGKSTLLHILGLLDRPSKGRYLFSGRDTATLSERERARLRNEKIGFVFQSFHLLSRATVLENVMLPLYYAKDKGKRSDQQRAQHAIEQVQLAHRAHHLPSQLSGGEKQRVALARALVNKPDIIFADEPTGNLDSKTGQAVMELVDNLHEQGHTIVVITHETSVAQYAQRIIALHDGVITSDQSVAASHRHAVRK